MRTPLTYILLALNIAAFAFQTYVAELAENSADLVLDYGMAPSLALEEPWRWATMGFLHLDVFHLVVNMASLWALGLSLERYVGSVRFGLVYGLGLLGGSAAVWLWEEPMVYTVGASGAIFALVGAGIVMHLRHRQFPLYELGVLAVGVGWAFYADDGTSWQAHAGGAIAGFLLSLIFLLIPHRERREEEDQVDRSQSLEYRGTSGRLR